MYLQAEEVYTLLQLISDLSPPGCLMVLDMVNSYQLKHFGIYARYLWGEDDPVSLLSSFGWNVTSIEEPGSPGASYNRYVLSPLVGDVRESPHTFFVLAMKA
eukprot:TRINITY_DN25512_c0_g1_i1.p1 TRINITY_DN25512_c0_g1~~TRINITY_DN25512_c0_g1_i1.p1  ORF type:complete len:102 (-),score=12.61 TRINITY_DN25512_c0_g1_i1:270-575(-)